MAVVALAVVVVADAMIGPSRPDAAGLLETGLAAAAVFWFFVCFFFGSGRGAFAVYLLIGQRHSSSSGTVGCCS